MAKPAYIIGAQTIIEDKDTSLVSAMTIIEKFTITVGRPAEAAPAPQPDTAQILTPTPTNLPWAVIAGWIKEPGDEGVEFEHQWAVYTAAGDDTTSSSMPIVPFSFAAGAFTQNRFRLTLPGMFPVAKDGFAIIESRIRKDGETDWLPQQFLFAIEVVSEGAEEQLE